MGDLFQSTLIADIVIGVTVLEFAGLTLVWYLRGWGIDPRTLFIALLPGIFLVLALRSALSGAPWPIMTVCLTAALAAHIADLSRRW